MAGICILLLDCSDFCIHAVVRWLQIGLKILASSLRVPFLDSPLYGAVNYVSEQIDVFPVIYPMAHNEHYLRTLLFLSFTKEPFALALAA